LLVAMRKAGEIVAIQRIFLDPATAHYTDKLVLGQAIGAASGPTAAGRPGGPATGWGAGPSRPRLSAPAARWSPAGA
jgi:hypothetical protein